MLFFLLPFVHASLFSAQVPIGGLQLTTHVPYTYSLIHRVFSPSSHELHLSIGAEMLSTADYTRTAMNARSSRKLPQCAAVAHKWLMG